MSQDIEQVDVEGTGAWTNNAYIYDTGAGYDTTAGTSATADQQSAGSVGSTPFADIGDSDTILGIEVIITSVGDAGDYLTVELYKPSASGYVATTKNATPPGSKGDVIAGGSSDLWGTTWNAADDIKQSTFGCRITYHNLSKANTISVYYILIRVTYAAITTQSIDKTALGRIKKTQSASKTADGCVKKTMSEIIYADGRVKKMAELTKAAFGRIKVTQVLSLLADGRVIKSMSKTLNSDGRVKVLQSINIFGDGRILGLKQLQKLSDGRVLVLKSISKTSNGTIAGGASPPAVTKVDPRPFIWR